MRVVACSLTGSFRGGAAAACTASLPSSGSSMHGLVGRVALPPPRAAALVSSHKLRLGHSRERSLVAMAEGPVRPQRPKPPPKRSGGSGGEGGAAGGKGKAKASPAKGGRGGGRGRKGGGRGRTDKPPQKAAADVFDGPMRVDGCHVAIIGGGLAGMACAKELARLGVRSTVFDTGEHGVGGRLATRASEDGSLRIKAGRKPPSMMFDHAAQYFTASDPAFKTTIDAWMADGLVAEWGGPVGTLQEGCFTPAPPGGSPRYVGVGGMRALCESIARDELADGIIGVKRPCWVSDMAATPAGWKLTGRQKDYVLDEPYDAVVIAHNGKCANRLVGPAGVPAVAAQLRRLKLSAIWAGMFAFEEPLVMPGGMEGAFVEGGGGSEVLSWVANNTAKLGLDHADNPSRQCWTLFSTGAFGRANKVPQEAVPARKAEEVEAALLAALAEATGAPVPPPSFSRLQLWGAALPTNTPRVPCILDVHGRVGVAGDWLTSSSMEAAALSGEDLARRLADMRGRTAEESAYLGIGLDARFHPVGGKDIGSFPEAVPAAGQVAAA